MESTQPLVVFHLGRQRLALPLLSVERVVPAVEVTPLPEAPRGVLGIINVQGQILPVIDIRRRFGAAERELEPNDHFLLVSTVGRRIALVAEAVQGVVAPAAEATVLLEDAFPDAEDVVRLVKLEGEPVLICPPEWLLSLDDEAILDAALLSA